MRNPVPAKWSLSYIFIHIGVTYRVNEVTPTDCYERQYFDSITPMLPWHMMLYHLSQPYTFGNHQINGLRKILVTLVDSVHLH